MKEEGHGHDGELGENSKLELEGRWSSPWGCRPWAQGHQGRVARSPGSPRSVCPGWSDSYPLRTTCLSSEVSLQGRVWAAQQPERRKGHRQACRGEWHIAELKGDKEPVLGESRGTVGGRDTDTDTDVARRRSSGVPKWWWCGGGGGVVNWGSAKAKAGRR